VATNLLLEGEDLEALLARAHAEGGRNARIVRAQKVRRGGFLGFFAREAFEVAVEIPAGGTAAAAAPKPADFDSLAGLSRGTDDDGQKVFEAVAELVRQEDASEPEPPAQPEVPARPAAPLNVRLAPRGPWKPSGGDAAARAASAAAAQSPAADRAIARDLSDEIDAVVPGRLAAESLASAAARVNAAERAAQPATTPVTSAVAAPPPSAAAGAAAAASPALAAGLEAYAAAGAQYGRPAAADTPETLSPCAAVALLERRGEGATGSGLPTLSTGEPGTTRPAPTFTQFVEAATRDVTGRDLTTEDVASQEADAEHAVGGYVPSEPPRDPVQPSTSSPAFSALLDCLRDEARPAGYPSASGGTPTTGLATAAAAGAPLQRMTAAEVDRLVVPVSAPAAEPVAEAVAVPGAVPAVEPAVEPGAAPGAEPVCEPVAKPEAAAPPATTASPRSAALRARNRDRRRLRALGVPAQWTRRLRTGDRFGSVLDMLSAMPSLDIDLDASRVVAVVGRPDTVVLEAHRIAIDLAGTSAPRPVVVLAADTSRASATALLAARTLPEVVVAVPAGVGSARSDDVGAALHSVSAQVVIAVIDASAPRAATAAWLEALDQVDALAVVGADTVADPAHVLGYGLPVIRLDGIPVDQVTWAAMLCAHLRAAHPAPAQPPGRTA
jgi:hypothetical protein